MNFSLPVLVASFVFGVLGFYFIKRARKNGNILQLIVGLILCVFPYPMENVYLIWGIGAALVLVGSIL